LVWIKIPSGINIGKITQKMKKKLKIAICYPPINSGKGVPLLSQNRQFQWFSNQFTQYAIYPVVMASAATLLNANGHQVFWLDGIAEKEEFNQYLQKLIAVKPNLIVIETKTPVIKYHWQIIAKIKEVIPKVKIVLAGDHVTALPQESFENSPVDYVLTGGDYDFALNNLSQYLVESTKLEPGVWYRDKTGKILNTGKCILNHDLDSLPQIDRDQTKWYLYAYKNSNFYRVPGAYTMFGRDCWWGKCTFCSWTTLYPGNTFRKVSVNKALDEIEHLVNKYSVKEIMDDTGTFPNGLWLRQFCQGMINRGLYKKVKFNCNLRFNSGLTQKDYDLMGKANFRFILFGLESAIQKTLDHINKNSKLEMIEPNLRMAIKAGLKPHLTVMIGYPWETETDIKKTLSLAKELFQKGLAFSMQATVVIPYPGTPLFKECQKNHTLKTTDWERYDMREPVMKSKIKNQQLMHYVQNFFTSVIFSPQFIKHTLFSIRNYDDLKYIGFQGLKYISKLMDFRLTKG
jgi:anaerobic magnesium-protoporphyrin IX monomethyl ester cyclase